MARIERQFQREVAPEIRAHNFEEVTTGFTPEQAAVEASRCLHCKNAPCMKGCPVGVHIPDFIRKVQEGDLLGAAREIQLTNNLPAVCGRVCPQEKQCEAQCVRGRMEGAVSIGTLERYVADWFLKNGDGKIERAPANGYRAAIVGSGPAGLTCAADLAKAGCEVTVYEAFHRAGGVLTYGIPEFRLPKSLVQREIEGLESLGVKIELDTVVGRTITLEELLENFDAVFIGTGAGLPQFLGIPGENLNGVFSANEFLTRVNLMKAYEAGAVTPLYRGKNVVVVGAGNVAMDAARTALRVGADKVTVVYRRGREEMPARAEEIRHAEEEGIEFLLLTNPVRVLGESRAEGLEVVRMELGEPDASGRRRPVEVKGSNFRIDCDEVIVALGTSPNPLLTESCPALETSKRGTILVNEQTAATSVDRVYAGGDAVTGAATVILAMGAGKNAAANILERLKASK